ncbi:MAG TPA: agmatine deiminase family protein, partial [Candidatus Woesebacteria bacterium]|nr:agmatine deiminase family protein [Candidatus Woesebacteria bacterium]
WMPNPLQGTGVDLPTKDFGLKFDGGAFFYLKKKDGTPYILASENEFINNNSYYIKQEKGKDIDVKQEVTSRIKTVVGENTEIIYLPKLADSGVDHIDTFVMPLNDDIMIVGESLEDDLNFELLNNVAMLFAEKGFQVHRVPIRRLGKNDTVTYTNILAHQTIDDKKYIFMPTYEGFESENDIAKTIYSNLGFIVVPIDASTTKDKGGSIHCATNTSVTAPFINVI